MPQFFTYVKPSHQPVSARKFDILVSDAKTVSYLVEIILVQTQKKHNWITSCHHFLFILLLFQAPTKNMARDNRPKRKEKLETGRLCCKSNRIIIAYK